MVARARGPIQTPRKPIAFGASAKHSKRKRPLTLASHTGRFDGWRKRTDLSAPLTCGCEALENLRFLFGVLAGNTMSFVVALYEGSRLVAHSRFVCVKRFTPRDDLGFLLSLVGEIGQELIGP